MSNDDKARCPGELWGSVHYGRCTRTGKYEHDGKLYCGQHHPPTVAARKAAREALAREEEARRRAARAVADAARKAAELRSTTDDDLAAECVRRGWAVTRG